MKHSKRFFWTLLACGLPAMVGAALAPAAQAASTDVPGLIHLWSGDGDATDSAGGADGTEGATTGYGLVLTIAGTRVVIQMLDDYPRSDSDHLDGRGADGAREHGSFSEDGTWP